MKKIFLLSILFIGFQTFAKQQKKSKNTLNKPIIECKQADSTAYTDYYGKYNMPANPYIKSIQVFFHNNRLVGKADEFPQMIELNQNQIGDEFEIEQFGAKVIFIRKSGLVSGAKITFQGQTIEGTKED